MIKDKANENRNSYANIGMSYQHHKYRFKDGKAYARFSGGDGGTNRFKVKEWEVFEVLF